MSYKFSSDTLVSVSAQVASFNSDVVDLMNLNSGSFQVVITTAGGVTWTVAVQGSNDNVTFIDTATPTAVSSSTNIMLSIADLTSRYYRVAFTRTSGTLSTATVIFAAKG
jgi:hypothetical protein